MSANDYDIEKEIANSLLDLGNQEPLYDLTLIEDRRILIQSNEYELEDISKIFEYNYNYDKYDKSYIVIKILNDQSFAKYASKVRRKWIELSTELKTEKISLDLKQKRDLLDAWENDNFSESADTFIKKKKIK